MDQQISFPEKTLSKNAVKVWLINEAIANGIGLLILAVLLYLDFRFAWQVWIGWVLIAITALQAVGMVWFFIHPFLAFKSWRYGVTEEFLQLKSGVLIEKYEMIPMTKIQSVATEQGPLLRKYGLHSVSVTTMGSTHTIPALPQEIAGELRNSIARYAKLKEVDV